MNGLWKKLWPQACSNLQEVEGETSKNTLELANEAGLEGVNEDDIELLQSRGEGPTNDKLAAQCIQGKFTTTDADKETPVRDFYRTPQQQHHRHHANHAPVHR
jgi:hypothetical protein